MIPKIIHYVWLTYPSPYPPVYPPIVEQCMASWKKFLPDYEVKLWNADNFDFSMCPYAEEAYKEQKYAFASDYVRLWALYNYGGIYLDSDVEVLRGLDELLCNKAFAGFEDKERIATCILGSEKRNPLFKEFMDDYVGRKFIIGGEMYDLTPNPVPITKRLIKQGLRLDGSYQKLKNITVYPMEYFCPFNPYRKSGDCFTEKTYCNHYFNGEWKKRKSEREKRYEEKEKKYIKVFGRKLGWRICKYVTIAKHIKLKK